MDLSRLVGGELNPAYQQLEADNGTRHYDFLSSMIRTAIAIDSPFISQYIIKALNFHAIVGLHAEAGEYRSCEVNVGDYKPPPYYRVQSLMDDFVNRVNWMWNSAPPTPLAAHALWRVNNIHPFVNGNGRTARAVCYFILCVKVGGPLPGTTILPELLRDPAERPRYVQALKRADQTNGDDLTPLIDLLEELLGRQLAPPTVC